MKVSAKTIQALALFIPKKNDRSYLLDINFELQLDRTILTATNGATLLSICIDEPNEKEGAFRISPVAFPKSMIDYEVSCGEDGEVCIINGLVKIEIPQIGETYPDFRRVIPAKPADMIEHKCYDPEYLMLFKKASKLLGGLQYPIVHPNNIVDIGLQNVVGVIVNLNLDRIKSKSYGHSVMPDWLK